MLNGFQKHCLWSGRREWWTRLLKLDPNPSMKDSQLKAETMLSTEKKSLQVTHQMDKARLNVTLFFPFNQ